MPSTILEALPLCAGLAHFLDSLLSSQALTPSGKADLVVFPENLLPLGDASLESNPILRSVSDVVKKHGVMVVLGTMVRIHVGSIGTCTWSSIREAAEIHHLWPRFNMFRFTRNWWF